MKPFSAIDGLGPQEQEFNRRLSSRRSRVENVWVSGPECGPGMWVPDTRAAATSATVSFMISFIRLLNSPAFFLYMGIFCRHTKCHNNAVVDVGATRTLTTRPLYAL